ncbi:BglG family transcription antiterminator [Paenibacillus sp. JSM ZJ436]|uniref:BglG family transcription antiterminator n=1 Tax=Paenibacillus sp. JSM ZJ436 TaxID=3376190 RepID=UPI0037A20473
MNKLTARQRQIIQLLLEHDGEITASALALDLRVSVRTIYREMEGLEPFLSRFQITLKKKSGKGIELEGTPEARSSLASALTESMTAHYSAEERRLVTLLLLLQANEPLKLFALAHTLKVTPQTITHDLNELEVWLHKFRLELVRRRGYGVEIGGQEEDKRKAICQLAKDHLEPSDWIAGREQQPPLKQHLLTLTGQPFVLNAEHILWSSSSGWVNELSEQAYTQLILSLSVSLQRIQQGQEVEASPASIAGSSSYMPQAQTLADQLAADTGLPISSAEVEHIAYLLHTLQLEGASPYFMYTDLHLLEQIHQLIHRVAQMTGYPLQGDKSLREGLLQHIDPALKRIREGASIRNPLLGSIRKDYGDLFLTVKEAVAGLQWDLDVPEEEIGFLTMHFGASLERLQKLQQEVRAILVCSSGIGSTQLLAMRLEKEIPQIQIIRNSSWYEAARIPEEEYDLIISTIDLPLPKERYIRLSPLLSREDLEQLMEYIRTTTLHQMNIAGTNPGNRKEQIFTVQPMDEMISLQHTLQEMVLLLERFHSYSLDSQSHELQEVLISACAKLWEAQLLKDPAVVTDLLLERERQGSLLIPDSSLALFHTRSHHILEPVVALFRFQAPLPMGDGHHMRVMLLMLAPKELPKEALEVLSEISAMLLRPELVTLMEQGSEQEIKLFLSTELLSFFKNK